jgi:hypothetical protein
VNSDDGAQPALGIGAEYHLLMLVEGRRGKHWSIVREFKFTHFVLLANHQLLPFRHLGSSRRLSSEYWSQCVQQIVAIIDAIKCLKVHK